MTGKESDLPEAMGNGGGRRSRRVRRRLIFVAALSLLTLVLLEVLLRGYVALRGWTPNCYAAQLDLLRPHPVNGYDLRPGFELRSGVFEITTNSRGLRGPEIPAAKPPGVVRIAVVGGSSVFGYLVNDGDEASRLLEHTLNAAGCPVEVINAGVPGYSLYHSAVRFREVVAPLQPDIVVLYAGHNDLGYLCSNEPDGDQWRVSSIAPAWERWLGHSTLYGFVAYRLLQRGYNPAVGARMTTPPTEAGIRQFHENLTAIADAVEGSGSTLVVCAQVTAARPDIDPGLRRHLGGTDAEVERAMLMFDQMHRALREFAEDRQVVYLDAGAHIPPTTEFLGDQIHLTREGEIRLANVLHEALGPLIPDCQDPAGSSAGPD